MEHIPLTPPLARLSVFFSMCEVRTAMSPGLEGGAFCKGVLWCPEVYYPFVTGTRHFMCAPVWAVHAVLLRLGCNSLWACWWVGLAPSGCEAWPQMLQVHCWLGFAPCGWQQCLAGTVAGMLVVGVAPLPLQELLWRGNYPS